MYINRGLLIGCIYPNHQSNQRRNMTTKPNMIQKYRPSNGAEGECFQEDFCYKCQFYQEEAGCPILNATTVYDVANEKYPNQWTAGDGFENPICSGFRIKEKHDSEKSQV